MEPLVFAIKDDIFVEKVPFGFDTSNSHDRKIYLNFVQQKKTLKNKTLKFPINSQQIKNSEANKIKMNPELRVEDIKKECYDMEELQYFSDSEDSSEREANQNQASNQQVNVQQPKTWHNEMLDFSSELARKAQDTLIKIKSEFQRNGMTFDNDFRNLFINTCKNR